MKIIVNYDLLEKVFESKHDISLVKNTKMVTGWTLLASGAILIPSMFVPNSLEFAELIKKTPIVIIFNSICFICGYSCLDIIFNRRKKAIYELKNLSRKLKSLNIDTTNELLQQAYKYKTEYELSTEEGVIPRLVQKKYINIPTLEDEEISISQEHTIGTRQYTLSKGKPVKPVALSPSFNAC